MYFTFVLNLIATPARKCIEDKMIKICLLCLTVEIYLVEIVYYLKFKQIFHLLCEQYDKSFTGGTVTFP